jgi:hypothetical protein
VPTPDLRHDYAIETFSFDDDDDDNPMHENGMTTQPARRMVATPWSGDD